MCVSDGGVSRISGRVTAKSKSVKSFDEHQLNNITATHSSIALSRNHSTDIIHVVVLKWLQKTEQ